MTRYAWSRRLGKDKTELVNIASSDGLTVGRTSGPLLLRSIDFIELSNIQTVVEVSLWLLNVSSGKMAKGRPLSSRVKSVKWVSQDRLSGFAADADGEDGVIGVIEARFADNANWDRMESGESCTLRD
jgi:hypothetical protein